MVVTISPSLSLYRIVVFPAASSPTIKIRISLFANRRSKSLVKVSPMAIRTDRDGEETEIWQKTQCAGDGDGDGELDSLFFNV
jgi:hypothetical protein